MMLDEKCIEFTCRVSFHNACSKGAQIVFVFFYFNNVNITVKSENSRIKKAEYNPQQMQFTSV